MSASFWSFDTRFAADVNSVTDPSDTTGVVGLNPPKFEPYMTLTRVLVAYSFNSAVILNDSNSEFPPFPYAVTVSFTPNPNPGEAGSEDPLSAMGGDALFTDVTRWRPVPWTDGATDGTFYHADSGGIQSVGGNRKLSGVSPRLHFGFQCAVTEFAGMDDAVNAQDLHIWGWMYVKWLTFNPFG